MTWAAELQSLRLPLVTNWNAATYPIAYPGEEIKPDDLMTGDPSSPACWVDVDFDIIDSEYLASGGGNIRRVRGTIDAAVMVEPVSQAADLIIRQRVDDLEAIFRTASTDSLVFHVPRARKTQTFLWEDTWIRADWICPWERFEDISASEEPILVGQSGNLITVSQASHGFSAGNWVGISAGSWVKANRASGIAASAVVSSVADADNFTACPSGVLKLASHGLGTGLLYLAATAGTASTTAPPLGVYRQKLGTAIDANYVIVECAEMTGE